jgi:hypothetical protein
MQNLAPNQTNPPHPHALVGPPPDRPLVLVGVGIVFRYGQICELFGPGVPTPHKADGRVGGWERELMCVERG